jgi:hypothetical protein
MILDARSKHSHERLVALDDGHIEDGARVDRHLHVAVLLLIVGLAIRREVDAVLLLVLRMSVTVETRE